MPDRDYYRCPEPGCEVVIEGETVVDLTFGPRVDAHKLEHDERGLALRDVLDAWKDGDGPEVLPPVYDRGEKEVERHGFVYPRDDVGPHGGMVVPLAAMPVHERPTCPRHERWQPLSWVVGRWTCPVAGCDYRAPEDA